MSNENHNRCRNWKSKLEELESLPGERMPDKNAAWEKIQARLDNRKPQQKAVWHRLAAACILFLFMISFFVSNRKNYQLSNIQVKQNKSEIKQKQHEKHISVVTVNHKKDSVITKNPALPGKIFPVTLDLPDEIAHINKHENKSAQLRLPIAVSPQKQITKTADASLQIIDTSSGFVSLVPAKKPLPVVHINELGDADNAPLVARFSEKPRVHFLKLGSQEVYNISAPITKNFATINFKTSPN